MTVIVEPDHARAERLAASLVPQPAVVATLAALHDHLAHHLGEDVVVLGPSVDVADALTLSAQMRLARPSLGVIVVRSSLDTSLLVDALRHGVRDVVADGETTALRDAVRRAGQLAHEIRCRSTGTPDAAERGVVVTVFSTKGGCGKTTLACNLAACLADGGGADVCLVDLDLHFGDVAVVLRLLPARTLADAVPHAIDLDDAGVESLLTRHSPGLFAVPAPMDPMAAETVDAEVVARVLRLLARRFRYVVVDTPPAFTDHVLTAFDQSDLVALVATLDVPAIKSLRHTLDTLEALRFPRNRLRVLLNRADSKVGLDVSHIEETLGLPIAAHIPSSRDVPASVNRGVPLMLDDPNHPVSRAIGEFAATHVLPLGRDANPRIPAALRADRRRLIPLRRRRP